MVREGTNEELKADLERIESHIELGSERILEWYHDILTPPDDFQPLETAPDQLLLAFAADLVSSGHELSKSATVVGSGETGEASDESSYIIFGIAAEVIALAVYLRDKPNKFVKHVLKYERTPQYGTTKEHLLEEALPDTLTPQQEERIELILDLLRDQRNHFAHFGFHKKINYTHHPLIYDVLGFLLSFFSEERLQIVAILEENRQFSETPDYKQLDYLPFDEKP